VRNIGISVRIPNTKYSNYFVFLRLDHFALAAILPISRIRFLESFLARAGPPFNPPFLPIFARYAFMIDTFSRGGTIPVGVVLESVTHRV
jgi:hypothetical protein